MSARPLDKPIREAQLLSLYIAVVHLCSSICEKLALMVVLFTDACLHSLTYRSKS